MDFKKHCAAELITRHIVGLLNSKRGHGLLVCGVDDKTHAVTGILNREGAIVHDQEGVKNAIEREVKKCGPPLVNGVHYCLHFVQLRKAAAAVVPLVPVPVADPALLVLVEVRRPGWSSILFKDAANTVFIRRDAMTSTLPGNEVYHVEDAGRSAHIAHTQYWANFT
jgi:hypothetical protein